MHDDDVSQFVIERFSDAINMVEVCSGATDERKCPHKVLFQKILSMKKECLFNILKFIERRVAGIIDQKILIGA